MREYAYWSQVLGGANGNFLDSSNDSDVGARKWQIALQIQSGDEDFIVSALKPLALCPQKFIKTLKTECYEDLIKFHTVSNMFRILIVGLKERWMILLLFC